MNFLLHRHLAAAELSSEVAGLGAMLPDLWRMAHRRMRAREGLGEAFTAGKLSGPAVELQAGIEHHLAVDRTFHESSLFRDGEAELRRRFKASGVAVRHLGLFAHVAWELCLDGALLRREGLAPSLEGLRRAHLIAGENLWRVAAVHARQGLDVGPESPFATRLEYLFAELLESDWIPGYQHAEGIAYRLAGVRRRIGLETFSPADIEALALALEPGLELAEARLDDVYS